MAVGLFDFETELNTQAALYENEDTPFRVELIAHSTVMQKGKSIEQAEELIAQASRKEFT